MRFSAILLVFVVIATVEAVRNGERHKRSACGRSTPWTLCCGGVGYIRWRYGLFITCCGNEVNGVMRRIIGEMCCSHNNNYAVHTITNVAYQHCCGLESYIRNVQFCCGNLLGESSTEICCDSVITDRGNCTSGSRVCCPNRFNCTGDTNRMASYQNAIVRAARAHNIDPSIVAGIISRESNGGSTLDSNGFGDEGNAFGVMQVDTRFHRLVPGGYNSFEHINQGTGILRNMIDRVKAKFPDWAPHLQLRGGIAAYNFGVAHVRTPDGIDRGTTNDNYSMDVMKRASCFRRHGY